MEEFLSRDCKFYWWVESMWLLLHKFWSHFGIFGVKYHKEKSHFQTSSTWTWHVYVVVQFYPWFKFSFLLFLGMVMYDNNMIMSLKQKKRKFEPRIKLNHNIYTIVRDTRSGCGGPLTWNAQIHDGGHQANFYRNLPSSCFSVQYNSLISMI